MERRSRLRRRAGCPRVADAVHRPSPWAGFYPSDVESDCASRDHGVTLTLVRKHVDDPLMMDLIGQYLHRTMGDGVFSSTVRRGIRLRLLAPAGDGGDPNGTDFGAADGGNRPDLRLLHGRLGDPGPELMAPTACRLIVNEILGAVRVAQHPGETFIGRIPRGFLCPGYWMKAEGGLCRALEFGVGRGGW